MIGFPARLASVVLLVSVCALGHGKADEAPSAYLAAYFKESKDETGRENSKLYYAIARTGFRFADAINQGRPVLASTLSDKIIRDPMILRGPGAHSFHLVATASWKGRAIILFDSTDLVHWSKERLVTVAPANADIAWAPELRWDPETRQYFAYWTSSTDNNWNSAAIWYATSRDLRTFSEPKVLMREAKGCLDADVVFAGGKWHMVYRYLGIWMRTADHAFGPYRDPVRILDLDVEGPFLFPLTNSAQCWGLAFDYFGGNQGRWGLATSTDFANWTLVTHKEWPYYSADSFLPPGVRHGCILPISNDEVQAIEQALGTAACNEHTIEIPVRTP